MNFGMGYEGQNQYTHPNFMEQNEMHSLTQPPPNLLFPTTVQPGPFPEKNGFCSLSFYFLK